MQICQKQRTTIPQNIVPQSSSNAPKIIINALCVCTSIRLVQLQKFSILGSLRLQCSPWSMCPSFDNLYLRTSITKSLLKAISHGHESLDLLCSDIHVSTLKLWCLFTPPFNFAGGCSPGSSLQAQLAGDFGSEHD